MTKPRTVSHDLPEGVARQPGSRYLYVFVKSPDGGPTKRFSTKIDWTQLTKAEHRAAARRAGDLYRLVEGMRMHPAHRDVARAVYDGTLPITQVFEIGMVAGAMGLRAALDAKALEDADIDLMPHLDAFRAHTIGLHLKRRGRPISANHRDQTVSAIRRYLAWAAAADTGKPAATERRPLSLLSPTRFQRYVAVLEARTKAATKAAGKPVKNTTGHRPVRDCTLALRQFVRFLKAERGVAHAIDPTEGKAPPANNPPRMHWLPLEDVRTLMTALPAPGGVYCAILHATALDTSDVARLTADSFERRGDRWMISASSKKTRTRRRRVPVHRWAIAEIEPYLLDRIAADGSRALLFPDWARWRNARDPYARLHAATVAALVADGHTQFAGYEPRDSRHSVAVQMCQAGIAIQLVAQQLGSAVDTVASTYAQWITTEEQWDAVLARLDAANTIGPTVSS
jgi:site-specific recombinase XerD